jgi:hypothetical protein
VTTWKVLIQDWRLTQSIRHTLSERECLNRRCFLLYNEMSRAHLFLSLLICTELLRAAHLNSSSWLLGFAMREGIIMKHPRALPILVYLSDCGLSYSMKVRRCHSQDGKCRRGLQLWSMVDGDCTAGLLLGRKYFGAAQCKVDDQKHCIAT